MAARRRGRFARGTSRRYPALPTDRPGHEEPAAQAFAAAEALEFRGRDPATAILACQALARSPRPEVQGGALVRLGRTLSNASRFDAALEAYDDLEDLGQTPVFGLPAALQAGEARGTTLVPVDGRDTPKLVTLPAYIDVRVDPDGRRLALTVQTRKPSDPALGGERDGPFLPERGRAGKKDSARSTPPAFASA